MFVKKSEWNSERFIELNEEDFLRLGLKIGEPVQVRQRRTGFALAKLANPHSIKAGEVGVGLCLQKRLELASGDEVEVTKSQAVGANTLRALFSVGHAPGELTSFLFRGEGFDPREANDVKLALLSLSNTVLRKGDLLCVHPLEEGKANALPVDEVSHPDVFRTLLSAPVYVKVVETAPSGVVLLDSETQVYESELHRFLVGDRKLNFEKIGGLAAVKKELRKAIEFPLSRAKDFQAWGIRPTKGILLFGAPGCGKTMLAKAVANELDAELIYLRGGEVYNPYFGASEQIVSDTFKYARSFNRSVIFWDEFDAVGTRRDTAGVNSRLFDTILNAILVEMDGMAANENIIVVAATNMVDKLDPALLRPGRFDKIINIPLPTEVERREILEIYLKEKQCGQAIDATLLAERTRGYTGADLENLVRNACILALEETPENPKLRPEHVEKTLSDTKPSLSPQQVEYYEKMLSKEKQDLSKLPMFG